MRCKCPDTAGPRPKGKARQVLLVEIRWAGGDALARGTHMDYLELMHCIVDAEGTFNSPPIKAAHHTACHVRSVTATLVRGDTRLSGCFGYGFFFGGGIGWMIQSKL